MASRPLVNFITGNPNKLREVRAILEPGIEVQNQNIDLEEVQGTIEEVTKAKCRKAVDHVSHGTERGSQCRITSDTGI